MTYQPPPPGYSHQPPPFFPPPPPRSPSNQLFAWVLGSFLVLLLFCLGGGALAGAILYTQGDPVLAVPLEPPPPRVYPTQPAAEEPEWLDEEEEEDEWLDEDEEEEEEPEPEPLSTKDGKKLTVTGSAGERFELTVKTLKPRTRPCNQGGYDPDGKYLLVDLTVKVLKGAPTVNPFSFRFFGADDSYATIEVTSGCDDLRGLLRPVPAGRTATARIAFDVSADRGEIEFMGAAGGEYAYWSVG